MKCEVSDTNYDCVALVSRKSPSSQLTATRHPVENAVRQVSARQITERSGVVAEFRRLVTGQVCSPGFTRLLI